MNLSQDYIAISIVVLAIIALLVFFLNKTKRKNFTPLAGLAFACIVAGIIFGDSRLIGYSLIGIGVILAIIDLIKKSKNK